MSAGKFRFLTIGWNRELVERLWSDIKVGHGINVSHLMHPRFVPGDWPGPRPGLDIHFFRASRSCPTMPAPDHELLASLEAEGVPTVHNMILGDRVVSKLPYDDALRYATFLAHRLTGAFDELKPDAVVSGFDALHAAIAMGLAKRRGIPWYALNFSVIPPGLACFCDRLTPAARVQLGSPGGRNQTVALAHSTLEQFETRALRAPAFITPARRSIAAGLRRLPARAASACRILASQRQRDFLRYTDGPARYSLGAAVSRVRQTARAHRVAAYLEALDMPPLEPFVLFSLHMQPESSIDVWAPFFSNQLWVIELLSRSVPPTHRLLIKIHKSDAARYSAEHLDEMRSFPGVALVRPFADARGFIERAALVISIQGTMGLEAALLGKPVIMLGESPVTVFPSARSIGRIDELPALVRSMLQSRPPLRSEIIDAFASYLAPFMPVSHNDWSVAGAQGEGGRFARLFAALRDHVVGRNQATSSETSL